MALVGYHFTPEVKETRCRALLWSSSQMKCEATKIHNLVGAEKPLSHGGKKKRKRTLYQIPDSAAQELLTNDLQFRWGRKVFSSFD